MLNRRALLGMIAVTPFIARPAYAASPETFAVDTIAIRGTDPVAYFTKSMPVAGSNDHSIMWKGAVWYFESAENMAMFEANPEKFAPQYGGYCAYAMSKGYVATSIPEAWTIHDDKLYLNFSLRARELWLKDVPGNIVLGDGNWPDALSA